MDILATNAYRAAVAQAAAIGGTVPRATEIAFGVGTTPASVEDTGIEGEVVRRALSLVEASGVELRVAGTLLGQASGDAVITEAGIFAEGGLLMGRRVFAPKQLEPESSIDFEMFFQF